MCLICFQGSIFYIIAIPHYEFGYDNIVYWIHFGSNNLILGYWNLNRSNKFWLLVPKNIMRDGNKKINGIFFFNIQIIGLKLLVIRRKVLL